MEDDEHSAEAWAVPCGISAMINEKPMGSLTNPMPWLPLQLLWAQTLDYARPIAEERQGEHEGIKAHGQAECDSDACDIGHERPLEA